MFWRSLSALRDLERIQYATRSDLEELQLNRLKAVVKYAYENVSYYRGRFAEAGITPDDIRDIGDIEKIPITTKRDLQERPEREVLGKGADPERCIVKHTSGSTGIPLRFFFSERERDFQSLVNLRILRAYGFKLTDKTAYLINPNRFPKRWRWFQYAGVLRRYYLSVFDSAESHLEALRRLRPDVIYGYPSNLTLLSLLIDERGIDDIKMKAIFSSAEALEPGPRALMASAMQADVCDILGLVETGDIAWECPAHEGYHVNSDAVVLEVVDDADHPVQPGEPGRLLCTSLYSYTMPLLRYEAGDICVPSDRTCSCGRSLPLLESIKGRANDFIVLPNGKLMASCFLVIIMQPFHGIAQYRIIQDRKDRLLLQFVKGKDFDSSVCEKIKHEIKKATGGALRVDIEILDGLPRDGSGKIRTVVSELVKGALPHHFERF